MAITDQWVEMDVDGQPMGAYQARPAGDGAWPGVIVFMEVFGLNSHIQDVTRRLAEAGYVALAIDFYHRVAPGVQLGYTAADVAEGREYKATVSAEDILADTRAAIGYLQSLSCVSPKGKMGTVGFCFGGHLAYRVAVLPEIAVTASFYGGGIAAMPLQDSDLTVNHTDEIRGKILCFFGDQDPLIPPDQVETIRTALERAGVDHQVTVYPGADHGFHCDQRDTYQAKASESAWQRTLDAFKTLGH